MTLKMTTGQQCVFLQLALISAAAAFLWEHERSGQATTDPYPFRNVSLPWDVRVEDIVQRLTLEEMQLQMARGGSGPLGGPAPAIPRLGIGPYQWDTECLRGDSGAPGNATAFPQAIGLAASFSAPLMFRVAEATGVEVRGKHNDFVRQGNYSDHTGLSCLSPVINIMRDSRWGRNQETYGEDPYLSGLFAAAYIRGLQGDDDRYVRASGGCKHLDAYGGPENIPVSKMTFNAVVSERDLRMTYLPAFRSCVQAGTYNLMCSYNSVNGVPACANKKLLKDIPRGEWGFKGYVIGDMGAIENIILSHHYLNNSVDTVAACVNAGCNLQLSDNVADPVYLSLVEAVHQGKVTEDRVREMVRPLFYTRMRLGEFDPPEMNPYSKLSSRDAETEDHKALAVEAAMKSFVLLKNDGVLPLKKTPFRSAGFVGPLSNDVNEIMGDFSANAPFEDITTPLNGLTGLTHRLQYTDGCNDSRCKVYVKSGVLRGINDTDINFVFLGTGVSIESVSMDRADTELPGYQKQLLQDVIDNTPDGTPIILLLFNAGPVNISFADQHPRVSAILECFFPAQAAGVALRHVLLNDVKGAVPAGRLPYTWPLLASQLPPMTNYSMEGRTYRYFEGEPLYPFGYGLSYTTFHFSVTHEPSVLAGSLFEATINVSNKGEVDADEVVQVYISWKDASLPAPKLQLAWVQRVTVAAGETKSVRMDIEPERMALWINDGWFITPGDMDLFVGGQQPFQKRSAPSNVAASSFTIKGAKYLGKY